MVHGLHRRIHSGSQEVLENLAHKKSTHKKLVSLAVCFYTILLSIHYNATHVDTCIHAQQVSPNFMCKKRSAFKLDVKASLANCALIHILSLGLTTEEF